MEPTFISSTSEMRIYSAFFFLSLLDSLGGSRGWKESTLLDIGSASGVMPLERHLPCQSNELVATHGKKDACITSQQHTGFPVLGVEHFKPENSGFLQFFKGSS